MRSVSDTQQNRKAVKQALESQGSVLELCDASWYLCEGIARLSAGQALGAGSATIAYQIGINFALGRCNLMQEFKIL